MTMKRYIKVGLVAGVLAGMLGCNATVPAAPVETVGTLSASYNSIAVAPVHATTDLTPQFGAVDSGDDVSAKVETVTPVAELPEVAPKTDGVTTGTVR